MPRDIPTPHPIDGVLITSKQLKRKVYADRLERQAQQHARQILRDAQQQAELIRQHAYQEGFQQGMLDSMQHVASFVTDNHTMAKHYRDRLSAETRAMLSASVDNPETLLLLLDEWLRSLPNPNETLFLTLPISAKRLQPRVTDLLSEKWAGKTLLDYHAKPSFVMRYADQVAEFSPEHYVEPATRTLLQLLDTMPQECHNISAEVLKEFIEQWQVVEPIPTNGRNLS